MQVEKNLKENCIEEILLMCGGVMKAMKLKMSEQLREYDMSFGEFSLLMFLARGGCDTSKDMARQQGYSRSLVSRMVDRLTKREMLTTRQDTADRRVMHLKLTDRGEEMVLKVKKLGEKTDNMIRQAVSKEDIDTLRVILGHIQTCFEQA